MERTRVLLADDHALLRAGMRALLEQIPGLTVVADAGDTPSLLAQMAEYRPDVVLLEIAMSGFNGLDTLTHISVNFPNTRALVVTMNQEEEHVLSALRRGAAGYLLKNATAAELQLAIEAVVHGDTYICPRAATAIAAYIRRSQPRDLLAPLTPRQRQILPLIAQGRSTKEIAGDLKISPKTVEMHRAQLMNRLQIRDIAGLVRYALRAGVAQG